MAIDRRTLLQLGTLAGASLALPSFANTAAPQQQRILVRNATLITMDPQSKELYNADVMIEQGVIRQIGKALPDGAAEVIDATDMIVIPGLVDSHWHLWNSLLRSSAPVPGGPAFFVTQQATSKRFSAALYGLSVRLGLAEAVNAGFTTVNSWSHNLRSPEYAQAELQALTNSGLRARLWYGYAQDLAASSAMDYQDIQKVQAQFKGAAYHRIDLGLAIRGPERTEAAIWQEEFAFAKTESPLVS
ncbi:hypothetical protein [Pseudomonas sp. NPDC089396]|uniref:hypothetical protein n=1 Tax=Pseudomonas sp. NPDC089396 TaxID=3364461 RepID=UPI003832F49F